MTIHMSGFDYIPSEGEKKESLDKSKLKDIFKPREQQIEEKKAQRTKPVKDIDPKRLRELESVDIKNKDWESIKGSSRFQNNGLDLRSLRPSRSERESDFGATGFLKQRMEAEMSNSEKSVRNSEFTDHAINSAKSKRKQRAEKGRPSEEDRSEWERITPAKNTKDSAITARGVTPNRSTFEPAPIPKVDLASVNKMKSKSKENEAAGKEAARLKAELDRTRIQQEKLKSNDWQTEAYSNIKNTMSRPHKSQEEKVVFAKDTVEMKPKNKIPDLSGVFSTPDNEFKDEKIKRDSSKIKAQRKKREDDRSWEVTLKNNKRR